MRTIESIVKRARRIDRIEDGLVLCDNCDNPASRELSIALDWTACGPCATGEADSLNADDFIHVSDYTSSKGRK